MAQVMHLEQFRLSQEAARCFDDDLDFCPSLTAKELSEIILASILAQKENQAKQLQQQRPSPTATPGASAPRMASRIPIVNPDNGSIVSVPEAAPTSSPAWYQNQFVAVR
ncbi:hypothetical protein BGZ70_009091 [Mortierella alpina]|uniref:Uncharacterized protein n=1 Tax=Mortierella alpina TaxID=64518 RepID=A0A9P6JD90_MORAP|nr:hypothetical protein BGZ70_009091 [Mortierella alpina]